jgi:hypothetical protein
VSDETLSQHVNPNSFLSDPVDIFDAVSEPIPPGTKAPPRPPGKERIPSPEVDATVAALITRIESALEVIHAALVEIKRLQSQSQNLPQSKAS